MEYEGQICRGPMERSSYMLPISVGCSYNACRFCTLFKHLTYRELPMEQIEEELKRVKSIGGTPKTIYLGDGNAFCADFDRLAGIIRLAREYFPMAERFNMDATVTSISEKTDEQLRELAALGVSRLYIGIETGLDDVLRYMNKDHTMAQAYEQIGRIHQAGIGYGAHMMTGVAGGGRGIENAEAIAEFFNRTKPEAIINFSIFLTKRAPLFKDIEAGIFKPADELENLREDRRIVELLDVDNVQYDGMHDTILVRVRGELPRDREKMLSSFDQAIVKYEKLEPVYSITK